MRKFFSMFSIFCYFSIVSVVIAFNISVHKGSDYQKNITKPQIFKDKYQFSYQLGDRLSMDIRLKNAAHSVTATAYIIKLRNSKEKIDETRTLSATNCKTEQKKDGLCVDVPHTALNSRSIFIKLQINQTSTTCSTIIIAEGNQNLLETTKNDMCVGPIHCIIMIDIQNACYGENEATLNSSQSTISITDPDQKAKANEGPSSSPPAFTITYITLAVIGIICVLMLAICLCVKKCYHRNLNPAEQMEMNESHESSKEIIYADLGLTQEDSSPPNDRLMRIKEEECPYAEIIGVLQPTK